jgi:hypothetical protein
MSNRPSNEEYLPYYDKYIRLVPEGNISDILNQLLENTVKYLSDIPENKSNYRYAPDKWSLKEVLGHINDTERIMSYRLLRIARGDATPLTGYDPDKLNSRASFDSYAWSELIEDYTCVRRSTISLIRVLSEEAWSRRGVASESEISAKALAYIIAGHELHHIRIIKERYLA